MYDHELLIEKLQTLLMITTLKTMISDLSRSPTG